MCWSLMALAEKAVLVSYRPNMGLCKCFYAALSLALDVTGRGAGQC